MKTRNIIGTLVAAAALGALAASCGFSGGGTTLGIQGTAPGTAVKSIGARSLARATTAGLDIPVTGGVVTLTTAKVVVKDFEFENGGVGDGSAEFAGPYIVDLIAGTMDPPPPVVDLPAGTYSELKFVIDAPQAGEKDEHGEDLIAATGDPNADMLGYSIRLAGTYTPTGGSAVPFAYDYNKDEIEFSLSGNAGFTIDPAKANDIIVAFRLVRWFDGIDLAAMAADPAAYFAANPDALKDSIKLSADYGSDADHDGTLESNEDDDRNDASPSLDS